MGKHVELDIEGGVQKLVDKVKGKAETPDTGVKKPTVKDEAKTTMWLALSMAVRRIATARDVGELTEQMSQVKNELSAGKDPAEVDGLRAAVMFRLGDVLKREDLTQIREAVEFEFKKGNVGEAIKLLKDLTSQEQYKIKDPNKKKQIKDLLDSTEELDEAVTANKTEAELKVLIGKVETERKTVSTETDSEMTKLRDESEIVERAVTRKRLKTITSGGASKKKIGRVERKKNEVDKMDRLAEEVVKTKPPEADEDVKFMRRLWTGGRGGYATINPKGDVKLEIERLDLRETTVLYGRINTLRGRYEGELKKTGNAELKGYLDELDFELREQLLELRSELREDQVAEQMVPGERQWEELPYEVRAKIENNMNFVRDHGSVDDLLQYYNSGPKEKVHSSEMVIKELIARRSDLKDKFEFNAGDVFWKGEADDFFELCRREVYQIKNTVPEERLGQLVFEEVAQTYMALMGVNTEGRLDLRMKKEAVTTSLYMEFALKSLWKAGGNHEAWKRASGMLLREGAESNFFMKMKAREKIRVTNNAGEELYLPGFNVNDIMTMAELKAPNGQSWVAYISPDNIGLAERRVKEYGQAMALYVLEKAKLRGEFSGKTEEYARIKNQLSRGELKINDEQVGWMRDYTHYVLTATMRLGEDLTLFDAKGPGVQDFDYASYPAGQLIEKMGMHAVLYYAFFGVTKYNYEAINNKLFMPLHGMLSYARGETLSHFLFNKSDEIYLKTPEGADIKTGKGANEFFFKGAGNKDLVEDFNKFWEDVWLDNETGTSIKMKGMRAIHRARAKGQEMMRAGKHAGFVGQMDFTNLEALMGHKIPGATNEEKLQWTVDNLDYDMLQTESMPSKREGDFINKYSDYFVELTKALQEFLNAPSLAGKMKIIDIVDRYNNGATGDLAVAIDRFMDDNRAFGFKLKPGGKWWNPLDYYYAVNVPVSPKDPTRFTKSTDGAHLEYKMKEVGLFDNYYMGKGLNLTRQNVKEGTHDPMIMKKIENQNMIAWGLVDPQEGARLMKEWQKDIYFGREIVIGGKKLRPGMIPFITPVLLFRGWWVDRMGLDWEDFVIALRKNNEEAWEKLKKIIGI